MRLHLRNTTRTIGLLSSILILASQLIFLSKALATPPIPSSFETSIFKNIDLTQYCTDAYGQGATPELNGSHAYDWECRKNGQSLLVWMPQVCEILWGADYSPALHGAHAYDWSCVNWQDAEHLVVPTVIIASDFFGDISAVSSAVTASAEALERVRSWYASAMSTNQTFIPTRPIIQFSMQSAQRWNNIDCLSVAPVFRDPGCTDFDTEGDRGLLVFEAIDEVDQTNQWSAPANIIHSLFVFTGSDSQNFGHGPAAVTFFNAAAVAPNVASCPINDPYCGLYPLGHELGHTFGLDHPCDDVDPPHPNCHQSIMQRPDISTAILLPYEQDILEASPFFFP